MELSDLVGKRVLTGVDLYNDEMQREYGNNYHGEHISFVLDGVTYTAREDEDDGYRSSMRDIDVSAHVVQNIFPAEEVVGRIRTECSYGGAADVLELLSTKTGEVVLSVGTDNCDDYYPSFVAYFEPKHLSANAAPSTGNLQECEKLAFTQEDIAAAVAVATADLQSRLDGCLRRLDIVRESPDCVVDAIDRLNFEVSELKHTNQILVGRLGAAAKALDEGLTYDKIAERMRGVTADPHDMLIAIMPHIRKIMRKSTDGLLDWEFRLQETLVERRDPNGLKPYEADYLASRARHRPKKQWWCRIHGGWIDDGQACIAGCTEMQDTANTFECDHDGSQQHTTGDEWVRCTKCGAPLSRAPCAKKWAAPIADELTGNHGD